jgi:hypothetical protein
MQRERVRFADHPPRHVLHHRKHPVPLRRPVFRPDFAPDAIQLQQGDIALRRFGGGAESRACRRSLTAHPSASIHRCWNSFRQSTLP